MIHFGRDVFSKAAASTPPGADPANADRVDNDDHLLTSETTDPITLRDQTASDLYEELIATAWTQKPETEPLARCLCRLVSELAPLQSSATIAGSLPGGDRPFDLVDFMNTLAHLGFRSSPLCRKLRDLDIRLMPCLVVGPKGSAQSAQADGPSVVSVERGDDGEPRLVMFCGTSGKSRILPADDPALNKTVEIIVFTRIEGTIDRRDDERGLGWIRHLFSRFQPSLRLVLLIGLALNLLALGAPLFIMLVYDRVIGPQATEPLYFLIAGAMILLGAEAVLRKIRSECMSWLTARLDFLVGVTLFDKLLRLPPRVIEQTGSSSHIARIKTFESVRDFFCGPALSATLELPSTLLSGVVILILGGPIVLVPIAAAILYALAFVIMRSRVNLAIRAAALESSIIQQFRLETIEKQESIRLDGLSKHWAAKHRELSGRETAAQYSVYILGVIGELTAVAITGLVSLLTLGVGAQLIWAGQMGPGELIAVMMLTWRMIGPFHALCTLVPRFEQARNAILQINSFMDLDTEEDEAVNTVRVPSLKGDVSLISAALRYEASAGPVFMGMNLEAKRGEIVTITGPNGSGKSSLLKLILGMQRPLLGSVRLDGFDIRQLSPKDLRGRIAYVPQDVLIFDGTLAENLRIAEPLADEDALWRALSQAGAAKQVQRLPEGLSTRVGVLRDPSYDEVLRQRIGLARAFLRDAPLVLIDEQPSSALRAGLDKSLINYIEQSRGQRTVMLVSHRADFIRMADRAIALRPGMTPIVGSPDQVLELGT